MAKEIGGASILCCVCYLIQQPLLQRVQRDSMESSPLSQSLLLRLKIFIVEKIIQIIGMYMVTRA